MKMELMNYFNSLDQSPTLIDGASTFSNKTKNLVVHFSTLVGQMKQNKTAENLMNSAGNLELACQKIDEFVLQGHIFEEEMLRKFWDFYFYNLSF